MVQKLSKFQQFLWSLVFWRGFRVPRGEPVLCYKDRSLVEGNLFNAKEKVYWGSNDVISRPTNPSHIGRDGVGSGMPMQLGRSETRLVTWGSGYGRFNQWKSYVPLPFQGSRYWVTGYPVPQFDKRCIIMGVDGLVHELIQFDQDLGILPAGMPQQALNRGTWNDGLLVDGVAITAAGLPGSAYVWGLGSEENPHTQAFTVEDYLGGDGSTEFASLSADHDNLPRCGDWYYLDSNSDSYKTMVAKGGQCEARARAMSEHGYGARLIDRGGVTSFLTQAGRWAEGTNLHEFTINLNDLRRIM